MPAPGRQEAGVSCDIDALMLAGAPAVAASAADAHVVPASGGSVNLPKVPNPPIVGRDRVPTLRESFPASLSPLPADAGSQLPTYIATVDGAPVGMLMLEHHNDRSAEMYVLAVRPQMHRHGLGRALVAAAESDLARTGTDYLPVKTLGARHPSEEYAATRAFYEALGYQGIEEFAADTIWPGNPCLIMVKHLLKRTD